MKGATLTKPDVEQPFDKIHGALESFTPEFAPRETGRITNVSTGIASVAGLNSTGFDELLAFPGGAHGYDPGLVFQQFNDGALRK